jgi:hypothetical protein
MIRFHVNEYVQHQDASNKEMLRVFLTPPQKASLGSPAVQIGKVPLLTWRLAYAAVERCYDSGFSVDR